VSVLPKGYAIVVVMCICVIIRICMSLGHISWMLPSEIFSLEVRFSAPNINVSVNMICTFAIAQIFTTMLCHMKFVLFIFSAFFVVVITAFICKLLPETKEFELKKCKLYWRSILIEVNSWKWKPKNKT